MSSERQTPKRYRVKLGLVEVEVECGSTEDAIRLARMKLSDDLPRLYDVIHDAEDDEFQVEDAETDPSS